MKTTLMCSSTNRPIEPHELYFIPVFKSEVYHVVLHSMKMPISQSLETVKPSNGGLKFSKERKQTLLEIPESEFELKIIAPVCALYLSCDHPHKFPGKAKQVAFIAGLT